MLETPEDGCKRERKIHFPHLLDYETSGWLDDTNYLCSGILCVTFTKKATSFVCRAIKAGRTKKTYVAMLWGHVKLDNACNIEGVTRCQLDGKGIFEFIIGFNTLDAVYVRTFISFEQTSNDLYSPLKQKTESNNPADKEARTTIWIEKYGIYKGKEVIVYPYV